MSTPPPCPPWLDDLVLTAGPPWLSMGVRALDLRTWLIRDERYDAEVALKARLRAERPDEVFAAGESAMTPSQEVLELVQAWWARHGGGWEPTLPPSEAAALHPLDHAGRLVQEDLCLMVRYDDTYRLDAASLCFPSHWRLRDKLGRSLAAIHSPVPHYAEELEAKVDTFFRRLRVDRPVQRRNLSIHNHDDLFVPEPHESPDSFASDSSGIDGVWLRSERQTLVRLRRSDAVLFTIKTQMCPASTLEGRPDLARALAAKLRAEERELRERRATVPFPSWLAGWLEDPGPGRG